MNPQRAARSHDPLQFRKPSEREGEILGKRHIVPIRHYLRPVSAETRKIYRVVPLPNIALTGIVRWICNGNINARIRQTPHRFDAIDLMDLVKPERPDAVRRFGLIGPDRVYLEMHHFTGSPSCIVRVRFGLRASSTLGSLLQVYALLSLSRRMLYLTRGVSQEFCSDWQRRLVAGSVHDGDRNQPQAGVRTSRSNSTTRNACRAQLASRPDIAGTRPFPNEGTARTASFRRCRRSVGGGVCTASTSRDWAASERARRRGCSLSLARRQPVAGCGSTSRSYCRRGHRA